MYVWPLGKLGFPFLKNKLASFYKILQAPAPTLGHEFFASDKFLPQSGCGTGQNLKEGVQLRYVTKSNDRRRFAFVVKNLFLPQQSYFSENLPSIRG